MKVYGDYVSGNCYKVKLVLAHLNMAYEWVPIDILKGETQTAAFLDMNPKGKIPVVQLDGGEVLTESNAIINYLADGTELYPADRLARTRILEWQFFEQYSHEPYIAVARFISKYLGLPDSRRADFEAKQAGGIKALQVMEHQLQKTPYLTGEQFTTADISLYAYTHVAHEGGFDLSDYPAIQAWLNRISQLSKHCAMV